MRREPPHQAWRCAIDLKTIKDQSFARLFTRFPSLFRRWVRKHQFVEFDDSPWVPFTGRIPDSRVALITTAGVHLKSDPPYDMHHAAGDPSFRKIPGDAKVDDLMITHNYYDHADADRDLNVVFPLERLRDLAQAGDIGSVSPRNFSFMGHIVPPHIHTLVHRTAPQVARMLEEDAVDLVLLTPA